MLILTIVLFCVGLFLALFSGIWSLVVAFQRHVLWGLSVILLPFAWLVFMFVAWEDAKRPFYWSLASLLFFAAAVGTFPRESFQNSPTAALLASKLPGSPMAATTPDHLIQTSTAAPERSSFVQHSMFGAQKKAELQIRLISLRQREADLLQRKAELPPGDRAAAQALTAEINKYNAELKPVLEQLKTMPPGTANPLEAQ